MKSRIAQLDSIRFIQETDAGRYRRARIRDQQAIHDLEKQPASALVSQNPQLAEIVDPDAELDRLKNEVSDSGCRRYESPAST